MLILETERLLLRHLEMGDLDDLYALALVAWPRVLGRDRRPMVRRPAQRPRLERRRGGRAGGGAAAVA